MKILHVEQVNGKYREPFAEEVNNENNQGLYLGVFWHLFRSCKGLVHIPAPSNPE